MFNFKLSHDQFWEPHYIHKYVNTMPETKHVCGKPC